jgi:hypothetical protein
MKPRTKWIVLVTLTVIAATVVVAQRRGGFRGPTTGRADVPYWSNEPGFESDTFVFTRVQYSDSGRGGGRGGGGGQLTGRTPI